VSNQTESKNILVLAATNRPWDLDEAALRRLTRRIYIPLPDEEAREAIISSKLNKVNHDIDKDGYSNILSLTKGYSCADLQAMIKEAAMQPVRELPPEDILKIKDNSEIRKLCLDDFKKAVQSQPPSVSKHSLQEFERWR
jgi:SpoVK/Ycf46/Vps4 family AAA+-type ATPase